MSDEHDKLIGVGEVADRFNVDPRTVNRWVRTGKLAGIRTPGGRVKIRESTVRAWLTADPQ